MTGQWIKAYRQMTEWEWYHNSQMVHLFFHLLFKANFKDHNWEGFVIKRGQLITGRKVLSQETGISEQSIRTCLAKLVETKELTIRSTNRFSIINICNYDRYQDNNSDANQQSNQQLTSNQPHYKKDKKDKKKPLSGKPDESVKVKEIITYLNDKASKNYKPGASKNRAVITARWNEGYREPDFERVINTKTAQWLGTEYEKYLRPETLFGPKFEGYVCEPEPKKPEKILTRAYHMDWNQEDAPI